MFAIARPNRLIILFVITLTLACCSHLQLEPAEANPSAYNYLAHVADQPAKVTPNTVTSVSSFEAQNELKFLPSYATTETNSDFDRVLGNVAFTYDNAVAILAFIAVGDQQRAKQLVDTLIYVQNHDRFYQDGRIRNAYRGKKLIASDGTVLMPGWFDYQMNRWVEDEFQISTHTGNMAWAMLALLGYYETYGGQPYLAAALRMGEWVEQHCRDSRGAGGYLGGFSGWEPNPQVLEYKSTEHNLDLYVAFERLYRITRNPVWQKRAIAAKQFVLSMWDEKDGKFWTGTQLDGVNINRENVPLDVQAWVPLALKEEGKPYWQSLAYAEKQHRVENGFDFNHDRDLIWYEGTAQMAVAYHYIGQFEPAKTLLSTLLEAQDVSGGIAAVNRDGLTTGFALTNGEPWLYFNRLHIGATAWLVFAQKEVNPFWIGNH